MPGRLPDVPEADAAAIRDALRTWEEAAQLESKDREWLRAMLRDAAAEHGASAVARVLGWDRRRLAWFLAARGRRRESVPEL